MNHVLGPSWHRANEPAQVPHPGNWPRQEDSPWLHCISGLLVPGSAIRIRGFHSQSQPSGWQVYGSGFYQQTASALPSLPCLYLLPLLCILYFCFLLFLTFQCSENGREGRRERKKRREREGLVRFISGYPAQSTLLSGILTCS